VFVSPHLLKDAAIEMFSEFVSTVHAMYFVNVTSLVKSTYFKIMFCQSLFLCSLHKAHEIKAYRGGHIHFIFSF
jgi:hypothetical protein